MYRAAAAAGADFSPRLSGLAMNIAAEHKGELGVTERLLSRISIFSTLTAEEKATIAATMQRKDYKPGEVIAEAGTVLKALCIVSYGALVGSVEEKGRRIELIRLVISPHSRVS